MALYQYPVTLPYGTGTTTAIPTGGAAFIVMKFDVSHSVQEISTKNGAGTPNTLNITAELAKASVEVQVLDDSVRLPMAGDVFTFDPGGTYGVMNWVVTSVNQSKKSDDTAKCSFSATQVPTV